MTVIPRLNRAKIFSKKKMVGSLNKSLPNLQHCISSTKEVFIFIVSYIYIASERFVPKRHEDSLFSDTAALSTRFTRNSSPNSVRIASD